MNGYFRARCFYGECILRKIVVLLAAAALFAGCVSSPSIKNTAEKAQQGQFPEKAELEQLKTTPPPSSLFEDDQTVEPESWEAMGPLSDADRAALEQSPWHKALMEVVSKRPGGLVSVSPEAECAAREYAKFAEVHRAHPVRELGEFLIGQCGATDPGASTHILFGDLLADADEAQVFERWKKSIGEILESDLLSGHRQVGVAFVREGNRGGFAIVSLKRTGYLDQKPVIDAEGKVTLSGEVLEPAANIDAVATRGEFATVECVSAADVRPPKFRFTCALDPKDAVARVDILGVPAGRILGHTAADVWLSPAGAMPKLWKRPQLSAVPAAANASSIDQLAAAVNAVRAAAGLKPVELELQESKSAAEVAPYYFGALTGSVNEAYADIVVLGLMAGWDVQGIISKGGFTAGYARGDLSVASLIASAVERPRGRAVLMDPDAKKIAIGALVDPEKKGIAATFTTYRVFETATLAEDALKVREALQKPRAEKGLPPTLALPAAQEPVASALTRVAHGELSSATAMQRAMQDTVSITNKGVKGWRLEVSNFDNIQWPEELLRGLPAVHIDVTHVKTDDAWGRYLIFIIVADGSQDGQSA